MRPKPITAGSCLFSPPWSRYLKHNVSVLTQFFLILCKNRVALDVSLSVV
jgi:hypothetical protein